MLLGKASSNQRLIGLATRNPEATRLLAAILEGWKLGVTEELSASTLALVEWGLTAPVPAERRLWLTPLPVDEPHLQIPMQLQTLHQALEKRLFRFPRRNLRVALHHPGQLYLGGEQFPVELCSLSRRGARLRCLHELEAGQELDLTAAFGAKRLVLRGRVLYLLPTSDLPGRERQEVGIIFDPADSRRAKETAAVVEALCLEQACRRAGIPRKAFCTSWFDVPRTPSLLSPSDSPP